MKRLLEYIRFLPALVALGAVVAAVDVQAQTPKRVLVVTVTKGFRHSSISTAEAVLGRLAEKSGAFSVDYVRNDEEMAAYRLRREGR